MSPTLLVGAKESQLLVCFGSMRKALFIVGDGGVYDPERELDKQNPNWIATLRESVRTLNGIIRKLDKLPVHEGQIEQQLPQAQ